MQDNTIDIRKELSNIKNCIANLQTETSNINKCIDNIQYILDEKEKMQLDISRLKRSFEEFESHDISSIDQTEVIITTQTSKSECNEILPVSQYQHNTLHIHKYSSSKRKKIDKHDEEFNKNKCPTINNNNNILDSIESNESNENKTPNKISFNEMHSENVTFDDKILHNLDRIKELNDLDDLILLNICSYLDIKSLCQFSLTCSYIKTLSNGSPWETIFKQKIGLSELIHTMTSRNSKWNWKDNFINAVKISQKWNNGGAQTTLTGHKKSIKILHFKNDKLFTCDENVIKEWDINSNKLIESFSIANEKYHTFCFDNNKLMISTVDTVRVYEQITNKLLFSLNNIISPVVSIKSNESNIYTGTWDGVIDLWSIINGNHITNINGHDKPIYCMDIKNDKIITGSSDKWLKIWDSLTCKCLGVLRGHTKTVLSTQLENNLIISGSKDNLIILWDIRSRTPVIGKLIGHNSDVTCIQFDYTKIVSGSKDKVIKVWDIRNHKWICNINGHSAGITCLEFDDNKIISGSDDAEINVWKFNDPIIL